MNDKIKAMIYLCEHLPRFSGGIFILPEERDLIYNFFRELNLKLSPKGLMLIKKEGSIYFWNGSRIQIVQTSNSTIGKKFNKIIITDKIKNNEEIIYGIAYCYVPYYMQPEIEYIDICIGDKNENSRNT